MLPLLFVACLIAVGIAQVAAVRRLTRRDHEGDSKLGTFLIAGGIVLLATSILSRVVGLPLPPWLGVGASILAVTAVLVGVGMFEARARRSRK